MQAQKNESETSQTRGAQTINKRYGVLSSSANLCNGDVHAPLLLGEGRRDSDAAIRARKLLDVVPDQPKARWSRAINLNIPFNMISILLPVIASPARVVGDRALQHVHSLGIAEQVLHVRIHVYCPPPRPRFNPAYRRSSKAHTTHKGDMKQSLDLQQK